MHALVLLPVALEKARSLFKGTKRTSVSIRDAVYMN